MRTPDFNINDPVKNTADVPCPGCGAEVYKPCRSGMGTAGSGFHQTRIELFQRTTAYQQRMAKK